MAWMQQRNEKFFTLFSKLWLERRQERRNRVAVAMSMSVAVGRWRRSAGMGIKSVFAVVEQPPVQHRMPISLRRSDRLPPHVIGHMAYTAN